MKVKETAIPKRSSHDPRWNELGKYVRGVADAMGLGQWYFDLSHDAPSASLSAGENEAAMASVFIATQSVSAVVHVGDEFWKQTRYQQRWVIVHELVHVHEAAYIKALESIFEAPSSTANIVNQLRERFVDEVALMLAPRYDLPPKGFKKPEAKKHKKKVGHVSRKRGEADL